MRITGLLLLGAARNRRKRRDFSCPASRPTLLLPALSRLCRRRSFSVQCCLCIAQSTRHLKASFEREREQLSFSLKRTETWSFCQVGAMPFRQTAIVLDWTDRSSCWLFLKQLSLSLSSSNHRNRAMNLVPESNTQSAHLHKGLVRGKWWRCCCWPFKFLFSRMQIVGSGGRVKILVRLTTTCNRECIHTHKNRSAGGPSL